jgi:adenylate cyclase
MNTSLPPSSKIRPVVNWILEQALTDFEAEDLLAGMAERLQKIGFELHRIYIANRILHPLYEGAGTSWRQDGGIESDSFTRRDRAADNWLQSTLRHMIVDQVGTLRFHIDKGEGVEQFPLIAKLQSEQATDYLALMTLFGASETAFLRPDGVIISWTTCKPGGWTEQEIADIRHIQSRFAVAFRIAVRETLARNVVSAYLGPDAGRRVLNGQFARGDGEDIDAVICFADLRSSTRLAEELGRDAFLHLLNEFFQCTAQPIQDANGEILNYIGDAVLAIFPYDRFGGPKGACQAALATAIGIKQFIAINNESRDNLDQPPIGFGIGIHPGRVMFGNNGIPSRLAFSVTGSAVNEAARITDLCRDLQEEIVVSAIFKDIAGGQWRAMGEYELRNVNQPVWLFAP